MERPGERPLRIGINALYLIPGKVGGTEIYLRNALKALAAADPGNEYFVFRNRETGNDLTPPAANFHDRPQRVHGAWRPGRVVYEQFVLPWVCARLRLSVLFNAGFTAPLLCACPMVTVFHDLQYKRHPEFFRWFDLPFWRILLPASAWRSRRIVVLSEAVKADVVRFYGYPPARVDVIPHGVEPEFADIREERRRGKEPARLILTVSTLHPHKNLEALLEAFQRFLERRPGWRLCVIGLKGFETENIEARRRDLGLEEAVLITGWVPREHLYEWFARADAFVYPSRFEGFGIPVLEALTAGIPTACSRIPSLVEIADSAVRFFDPNDVADILRALEQITGDEKLRTRLREEGPRRALLFSREQSGRQLVRALGLAGQPATRSKNFQDF